MVDVCEHTPQGGNIVGADNEMYNIVDLLGGGTPVNSKLYDITQFQPKGGLIIGSDNRLYDLVSLIKNASTNTSGSLPTGGEAHKMLVTDAGGNAGWVERTHWTELKEGFVLPENTPVYDENVGIMAFEPFQAKLIVGQTYTVNWNGTAYESVATAVDSGGLTMTCLGNIGALGGEVGEVNEIPFFLAEVPADYSAQLGGATAVIMALDGTTELTVSVYGVAEFVHKIPEKYLPEFANGNILNGSRPGALRSIGASKETGAHAFALGENTSATGDYSVAIGRNCVAEIGEAIAIGVNAVAQNNSFVIGQDVKSSGFGQVVLGRYNVVSTGPVLIIGGGSYGKPKNVFTVDLTGDGRFAGTVEGTALILVSSTTGSTKRFKITVDDSGTIKATEVT